MQLSFLPVAFPQAGLRRSWHGTSMVLPRSRHGRFVVTSWTDGGPSAGTRRARHGCQGSRPATIASRGLSTLTASGPRFGITGEPPLADLRRVLAELHPVEALIECAGIVALPLLQVADRQQDASPDATFPGFPSWRGGALCGQQAGWRGELPGRQTRRGDLPDFNDCEGYAASHRFAWPAAVGRYGKSGRKSYPSTTTGMCGGKCLPRSRHALEGMGLTVIVHPCINGFGVQPIQGVRTLQMDPANTGKKAYNPLRILHIIRPVPLGRPGSARQRSRTHYDVRLLVWFRLSGAAHQGNGQGRRQKKPQRGLVHREGAHRVNTRARFDYRKCTARRRLFAAALDWPAISQRPG